jgi:hypothetical protein
MTCCHSTHDEVRFHQALPSHVPVTQITIKTHNYVQQFTEYLMHYTTSSKQKIQDLISSAVIHVLVRI